jgi:hypothetical protein
MTEKEPSKESPRGAADKMDPEGSVRSAAHMGMSTITTPALLLKNRPYTMFGNRPMACSRVKK